MNEKDAISRLSKWFKADGWVVLQDQINDNENAVFHIKRESKKKPDLIVKKSNIINAIEVKIGNDGLPLRTNSDLVTYFCNYNEGKTFYFDEKENFLSVDNFTIASYFSPEGYLREGDQLKNHSERHYNSYLKGLNPKQEYCETHQIIRGSIWDVVKFNGYYKKYSLCSTGIGAVLSTKLDGDGIGKPAFFVMKNHPTYYGSTKWWHQWLKI